MPITSETLRLVEQMRRAVNAIVDNVTRVLVEAWVKAWDQMAFEVALGIGEVLQAGEGQWPARKVIEQTARMMRALDVIAAALARLAELTRSQTLAGAAGAARIALDGQGELIASQLPYGSTRAMAARYRRQQPDTVDAIVRRTAEQINAAHWPLADEATAALKRELIRGVVVGDNPRAAASRMLRNLEGEFNGGLTRAMNLSRTEILSAHREAAEIGQQEHGDVLDGWRWHADLSRRTCPSCLVQHGKVYPLSQPGPWDHQQGRCARVPLTKSWADLGFDIPEPPDTFVDAREWFDRQSEADQTAIMGRSRLDLLKRGEIDWDDLSVMRDNPGWRPSYRVPPLKDTPRRSTA
ncbi:hypothetical protein AB0395_41285 [Streptosporangium sp. NPDC051023]|uniref:hypothetical protein n=1 Tax=Streptosporangium sp. NPDC051023 TaxID=3155410 RepID=UPI00344DD84B